VSNRSYFAQKYVMVDVLDMVNKMFVTSIEKINVTSLEIEKHIAKVQ
jgi:hypothetical protein